MIINNNKNIGNNICDAIQLKDTSYKTKKKKLNTAGRK